MKLTIFAWPELWEDEQHDYTLSLMFTKFWDRHCEYSFNDAAKLFAEQCNLKVFETYELKRCIIIDITKEELLLLHIQYG